MPTHMRNFTRSEAKELVGKRVKTAVDVDPVGIGAYGTVYSMTLFQDGYDIAVLFGRSDRSPALNVIHFTRKQCLLGLEGI